MRSELRELYKEVTAKIEEVAPSMSNEEAEEFYNRLAEWSYGKYEEAILSSDLEMQDYDAQESCAYFHFG